MLSFVKAGRRKSGLILTVGGCLRERGVSVGGGTPGGGVGEGAGKIFSCIQFKSSGL